MFKKKKKNTLQFSPIYFTSGHKSETILFPLEKFIQIGTTSLSIKYENKKVTLKL